MPLLNKFKQSLQKTKDQIFKKINNIFTNFKKIDPALFEELKEQLILADVGMDTANYLCDRLKEKIKIKDIQETEGAKNELINIIHSVLAKNHSPIHLKTPMIILLVGVNGVGKTTCAAKLAYIFKRSSKKIFLVAADTFRAAAIEQLEVWGNKIAIPVIKNQENSDPASVVFKAITLAKNQEIDIIICDTSGRLHNKKNLMDQLAKISKVIKKTYPEAALETLLILDASCGQNALIQAKQFNECCNITGIILNKIEGSAKGGIVISICNQLKIGIKFIGYGEKIEDIEQFEPQIFAQSLFE